MGNFAQDLTYAFRTIRRSPGFLTIVVLSIALGIAANTTIFSIANAVLLGELPVREPDRLVNFANTHLGGSSFSYPNYVDLRDQSGVFEGLAASFPLVPVSFSSGTNPERIWGQLVTGNYFSVIGVPIVQGRAFRPEEDQAPGRDAVTVLSNALWKRRFGSDPGIVGRTIVMNNRSWKVVGVAAPGFHGTTRMLVPEFWAPLAMHAELLPELTREGPILTQRDGQWLMLDGRLKPGVSCKQALAAVNVVNTRLDETYRKNQPKSRIILGTSGKLPGDVNPIAFGLMAGLMIVVGLVLVIACANVANLLLARAAGRQREIAVRLAVGASRSRLILQLLTESVLLSLLGAAAGFLLSFWATASISRLQLPIPFPIDFHFAPDLRVLAFTIGLSLLTGILFGLAPALRATRPDLIKAIKSGDIQMAGFRRFGLRNSLVVIQVTFSLVLLVSAGLFLRSLQKAASIDLGIRPGPVLAMAFDPNQHSPSKEKIGQFLAQLKQRVAGLPGIASVSYVDFVPLSIGGHHSQFSAEDSTERISGSMFLVGSRYFETMGIPIVRGRDFGRESADGTPVAIINQAMAERLFARQDPLSRRVRDHDHSYEIAGVVRNSKSQTLGEGNVPCLYISLDQNLGSIMSLTGLTLVAKASTTPATMIEPIRREIEALDPNLAVFNVQTMQEHAEKALLLPRLTATLFAVFGTSGLALAIVGLYGVMSFSVGRRTKEIGIRMALGAHRSTILGMVTRQGMALTAVGIVIGMALSLAASRFASSLLYGVSPWDALTFIGVPVILLAVAFVASLIPARRAAKLDPLEALRYE